MTTSPTSTTRFDRPSLRRSIVVGVIVALILLAGGLAYALTQRASYTAESVVVVLPAATLDDAASAAYYETLSRGQIVATFAEVAGNLQFEQQAEQSVGLSPAQAENVTTEVTVVPDTAVILIRTTAPDAATAEKVADAVTSLSAQYWAGLSKPYSTRVVGSSRGTAVASGTSQVILIGAAVAVALVAGLAVQQAIYHLGVAVRQGRASAEPDPAPRKAAPDEPVPAAPAPDPDESASAVPATSAPVS